MTLKEFELPRSRMSHPVIASIGRLAYRFTGWKCVGEKPRLRRYVVIAAPHTSNWDGFYLFLAAAMLGLELNYFGKHSLFVGPLGWFLRFTGGIPLNRSARHGFVDQAVDWFAVRETFALGVAPEGTRFKTAGWKTGFYYIALRAKVPVALGFIDYANREAGLYPELFEPTGDIDRDFDRLREIYSKSRGYRPEWAAPVVPLKAKGGESEDRA